MDFLQRHAFELIGFAIELIVLLVIFRELRELRRHQAALQAHEHQLQAARPLMSTLYTDDPEIMDVAISFTEKANMIYALGTIASLREMERVSDETISDYERRLASVDAKKKAYVAATLNRILAGCKYRRVLDFLPELGNEVERLEINC